MLQTERRHDPYPFTWELPAALLAAALLTLILGVHVGRSLAVALTGQGWLWTDPRALLTSLPGILTGHPGSGLSRPVTIPGPVLAGCISSVELVVGVLAALGVRHGWRRWGPGRMHGMASPADAQATLGVSRLRRVRHIIRPDLYPATRPSRRPSRGSTPA